jgi:hypothetical protein
MNYWLVALVGGALILGVYLGWQGRKLIDRLEQLEQVSKRRKLPYPAMAGLEDAIALADDGQFENASMDQVITRLLTILQHSEAARKYMDARLDQVADVLRTIRSDPHGYDVNSLSKKP